MSAASAAIMKPVYWNVWSHYSMNQSNFQQNVQLLKYWLVAALILWYTPWLPSLAGHVQLSHLYKVYGMFSQTPQGVFLTIKADLHFVLKPQPPGHERPIFFLSSSNFFCQSFAHPVSPQPVGRIANEIHPTSSLNLVLLMAKRKKTVFTGKSIKLILTVNVPCNFYFVFQ